MEHVEAIIVGAGLSGLACAYALAEAGVETVVLERGDYPGAKNVSGGRIYLNPLKEYLPSLWQEAPFERRVTRERLTFLSEKKSTTFEFEDSASRQSATLLRSTFDRWLADRASEKGALIVPKMVADDFVYEGTSIRGIVAGGDEMNCDVLILADGANSLLAEKAQMRKTPDPKDYAVGAKEVIELPQATIDERFGLRNGEGASNLFLGVTHGVLGGGFLYTNRNSVSLGIVATISSLMHSGVEFNEFIEEFREVPLLARLLEGGTVAEYSAHLIPEGGYHALPRLSRERLLVCGDAAGLCLNMGFTVKGMDYAIASGVLAARAAIEAKERGDFSAASLMRYDKMLGDSYVMKDMRSFAGMPRFLEGERMYEFYPKFLCETFESIFSVNTEKEKLSKTAWRQGARLLSGATLKDVLRAVRYL